MSCRVALAQYLPATAAEEIVGAAQSAGAEIVVLPGMFSNGHARFDGTDTSARARWCQAAESLDGEFLRAFRAAARRFRMHVVATWLESAPTRPFDSAVLIDRNGQIALHYRKVHICDFDVPEMACAPGSEYEVATIDTGSGPVTVGIMICMDREFEDAASSLSAQGGEVILVPNTCPQSARPGSRTDFAGILGNPELPPRELCSPAPTSEPERQC